MTIRSDFVAPGNNRVRTCELAAMMPILMITLSVLTKAITFSQSCTVDPPRANGRWNPCLLYSLNESERISMRLLARAMEAAMGKTGAKRVTKANWMTISVNSCIWSFALYLRGGGRQR